MNETGRLLRYAIPGGLFELVLALWLIIDDRYVGYHILTVDSSIAALIAVASFPVGFLVSVVAAEMRWAETWPRLPGPLDWPRRGAMRLLAWPPDQELSPLATALIDAVAETTFRTDQARERVPVISNRLQGLLDLMNGLANAVIALLAGWFTVAFVVLITSIAEGTHWSKERAATMAAFSFVVFVLVAIVSRGQRRVAGLEQRIERGLHRILSSE